MGGATRGDRTDQITPNPGVLRRCRGGSTLSLSLAGHELSIVRFCIIPLKFYRGGRYIGYVQHTQGHSAMNAYAMKQYQTVNVHAQVSEANPHRLIQMLFEGGLQRLAQAKGAMQHGNLALKGELVGKAVGIINGLRDGLDLQKGGELSANLDNLYAYMIQRLSQANLKNDPAMIDEVAGLLREIKEGWDTIQA
ncbi:flagellar biosynthetic protein FliS [Halopseudomonas xinjiangensis]|uniref:Flagellar biosynthetic protein FliS n=2 Tax=Halopseudomonas xinjiangensis TaxID=487184 RepID=A0A1H1MP45_9GAMM|nr:flagellar biosynthetic protein FliS [Halopseudomonas xinjiangensis]